jgi:Na+-driven multidrug efflux pump
VSGTSLNNTICLGFVGLIFLLFAPQLIGLFSSDPEVVPYGVRAFASWLPGSCSTDTAWC